MARRAGLAGRVGVRRAAVAGLVALLVVPAVAELARARGVPALRSRLDSGGAWLASPAQGVVTLIDGPSEQVVGLLRVAGMRPGDDVSVVQTGSSAYVADATAGTVSRVDGGRWEVSPPVRFGTGGAGGVLQVFPGGSSAYVVDGRRRLASVLDPVSLRVRRQLSLSAPLTPGQAVVDDDGRLWVVDGGGLARFDAAGKFRRPDAGGPDARLVLVRGRPVLVDLAGPRVGRLTDSADVRSWSCLDLAAGEQAELAGSTLLDRVLAVLPATGAMVESGGEHGDCGPAVASVGRPGDSFGPPVESSGFVFVPDWSTGRIAVVDLAAQAVVSTLPVVRPANRLELVVKDGLVFYNNLDGDEAGVIRFDGRQWRPGRSLRKYSTGKGGVAVLAGAGDHARPQAPGGPGLGTPTGPAQPTPGHGPGNTPGNPPGGSAPPGGQPPGPTQSAPAGQPPGGAQPPGGGQPPAGQPPTSPPPATGGPGPAPPVLRSPVVRSVTIDPPTVVRDVPARFSAVVDNAQQASWAWTIKDPATGTVLHQDASPDGFTFTVPVGSANTLQLDLVVTNKAGTSPTAVTTFATTASLTPQITNLAADKPSPAAGDTVSFSAQENVAGDRGTWIWQVEDTDTGATVAGPAQRPANQPFPVTLAAAGHYRATLTVSFDGATDRATVDVTAAALFPVRVTIGGSGTGTVAGAGLSCTGNTCTGTYRDGSPLALTATPTSTGPGRDSAFAGWSGPCGGTGDCALTVTGPTSIGATFDALPPKLVSATITFHTRDDDKDNDTRLTIEVTDSAGNLVASRSEDFGTFPDNTARGPFDVPLTTAQATDATVHGGNLHLHVDPNGNDTWRFAAQLTLTFADGSTIVHDTGNAELSQDSRDGNWQLP